MEFENYERELKYLIKKNEKYNLNYDGKENPFIR